MKFKVENYPKEDTVLVRITGNGRSNIVVAISRKDNIVTVDAHRLPESGHRERVVLGIDKI